METRPTDVTPPDGRSDEPTTTPHKEPQETGSRDAAASSSATESLWKVYSSLNEWIRFTDTKAGATLAADRVLAGAAVTSLQGNRDFLLAHWGIFIAVSLAVLAIIVSAAYCIFCISPSVETGPLNWRKFSRQPLAEFSSPQHR